MTDLNFANLMRYGAPDPVFSGFAGGDDPLQDVDLLREAQILDLRCDCVTQTVGILLEMRMAFAGGGRRAALLVGRGTREVIWDCTEPFRDDGSYLFGRAWNVTSSIVAARDGQWNMKMHCIPAARLSVSTRSFEFYLAEVAGLDAGIPDYTEGPDEAIRADLPDWDRSILVERASRRDAQ